MSEVQSILLLLLLLKNFVSPSNLSQAFRSGKSSCNLVRVNSTLSVLPYCLVIVKFCGFLNSSRPCV